MHRLLILLCAHVNAPANPPLPSLQLIRHRRSFALLPAKLQTPSTGLLLLLRPRRKMPSLTVDAPAAADSHDDEEIVQAAKDLTDSTLKRALAQLITEAIDLDAEKEEKTEEEVVDAARGLVSQVLRESWTIFLQSCDLDEWLENGDAQMSHRMATDLLHTVQQESNGRGTGGKHNPSRGSGRPADKDGHCAASSSHQAGSSSSRTPRHDSRRGNECGAAAGEEIRFHYDNNDCRIDLQAVQPYAAVLEHSNSIDKEGNEVSVLLFDTSQLPAKSVPDYDHLMQQILLYSIYMVEQHMYSNYSIVYLHGNAPKDHWPRPKWLRQWCHALNSKTSKHLTQMMVLYPTLWIRTLRIISRPFVKFKPAVHFVSSLKSLYHHLPESELVIPKAVKEADTSL